MLILLNKSGAPRLRRKKPLTVVLTDTKDGLIYKFVLANGYDWIGRGYWQAA